MPSDDVPIPPPSPTRTRTLPTTWGRTHGGSAIAVTKLGRKEGRFDVVEIPGVGYRISWA